MPKSDCEYYRLTEDWSVEARWFLGFPMTRSGQRQALDLRDGKQLAFSEPIELQILTAGPPLDYVIATGFAVPVLSYRGAEAFRQSASLGEIQLFPAIIRGINGDYEILNITRQIDCIDWSRTQVTRTTKGELLPVKPVIDHSLTHGAQIFRVPPGQHIVMTRSLKSILERAKLSGVGFVALDSV